MKRRKRRQLGIAPCETYPDSMRGICHVVERQQAGRVRRSNRRGDNQTLDLYSASAIMSVYDGLSADNRQKYASMTLDKMASVAFRLIK